MSYRLSAQRIAPALAAAVAVLLLAGCGTTAQAAFRALPAKASPFAAIPNLLNTQARALEQGDEAGWLGPLDTSQPNLLLRYQELFRSMRAIGVSTLIPIVTPADVTGAKSGPLTVVVGYAYCIQLPACPTTDSGNGIAAETFFTHLTFIERAGHVTITTFELVAAPSGGLGRAPWLDERLEFLTGTRATVIASANLKKRMPAALAAADAAATVADRFAQWVWPTRYIVYLANPAEWSDWIAKFPNTDNVVAYTAAPSSSSEIVVVNVALQDTNADSLVSVLRHEFGHVVTLLGVNRTRVTAPHLFLEGIAEYIAEDGRPLPAYLPLSFTRRYIHSGRWDGNLDSAERLFGSDRLEDVEAAYGMGLLTWRCISSRYGQTKLLAFAERLFRKAASTDAAAATALGDPWSTVNAACAAYLRAA